MTSIIPDISHDLPKTNSRGRGGIIYVLEALLIGVEKVFEEHCDSTYVNADDALLARNLMNEMLKLGSKWITKTWDHDINIARIVWMGIQISEDESFLHLFSIDETGTIAFDNIKARLIETHGLETLNTFNPGVGELIAAPDQEEQKEEPSSAMLDEWIAKRKSKQIPSYENPVHLLSYMEHEENTIKTFRDLWIGTERTQKGAVERNNHVFWEFTLQRWNMVIEYIDKKFKYDENIMPLRVLAIKNSAFSASAAAMFISEYYAQLATEYDRLGRAIDIEDLTEIEKCVLCINPTLFDSEEFDSNMSKVRCNASDIVDKQS